MKRYKSIFPFHSAGKSGDRRSCLLLLFVLGYSTILSQVLLFREFIAAFGGNELIIGIFLSAWMILYATGAYAGKFFTAKETNPGSILAAVYITGFLPLFLLFLIDFLRNRVFLPGIQPGILQIMTSVVILLSAYCLVAGFLFTRIALTLRNINDDHVLDESYAAESLGSMTGGVLFSFLMVYLFDNLQTASITIALTTLAVVIAGKKWVPAPALFTASFIAMAFVTVFFAGNGSRTIRKQLFPDQEIIAMQDTRYGNLTVTKLADQLNFYQNNTLLYSTEDHLTSEEAVHYAMVQHQDPAEVLLISGGIGGLIQEILKYGSVRHIDYVELDPAVFLFAQEFTNALTSDKVIPHPADARRFVRNNQKAYDVVIMDLPEPSTLELNRYFTLEFFRKVKDILSEDGLLTFSLPSSVNYMNEQGIRLNSSLYNTCRAVFQHVVIYPVGRNIFVASDAMLGYNITPLIGQKGIQNDFVNPYYIDDFLNERRADELMNRLSGEERVNKDFRPVALYGFLDYWMSQFHSNMNLLSFIFLLLTLSVFAWFLSCHLPYAGMFAVGFSASSLQIILLISFQIIVGHIYHSLGLFIAVFMGGLAAGALARQRLLPDCTFKAYSLLQFTMVSICCIIPLLIILLSNYLSGHTVIVHLLFSTMIFSVSLVTGILFSASLKLAGAAKHFSGIYATDMAGAALGAILTTLFLIPVAGILNTSFTCAVLLLIPAFIALRKRNAKP